MEVKLLSYMPRAAEVAAASALMCRTTQTASEILEENEPEWLKEKFQDIVQNNGHTNVLEWCEYVFEINLVSRGYTHEAVRHRVASYLQMSTRAIDFSNEGIRIVIPDDKELNTKESLKVFKEVEKYLNINYNLLIDLGEKPENARQILPIGLSHSIVVKMNGHSLLNFFQKRLCNRSHWEIREVANRMLGLIREVDPEVADCFGRPCELRWMKVKKESSVMLDAICMNIPLLKLFNKVLRRSLCYEKQCCGHWKKLVGESDEMS
ncbi:MAG: FAD-dependent thymidylate synthase [Candidatus Hodarchaeales archaeon]